MKTQTAMLSLIFLLSARERAPGAGAQEDASSDLKSHQAALEQGSSSSSLEAAALPTPRPGAGASAFAPTAARTGPRAAASPATCTPTRTSAAAIAATQPAAGADPSAPPDTSDQPAGVATSPCPPAASSAAAASGPARSADPSGPAGFASTAGVPDAEGSSHITVTRHSTGVARPPVTNAQNPSAATSTPALGSKIFRSLAGLHLNRANTRTLFQEGKQAYASGRQIELHGQTETRLKVHRSRSLTSNTTRPP